MAAKQIAIIAPGEMGHAVGAHLRAHGAHVSTSLAGRSDRSAERARSAGMVVVPDDDELVGTAEIFLSIVPPAAAVPTAVRIAATMQRTGATPVYADCNAVAPATAETIGRTVTSAGAPFVDAGIIGGPPRPGASGPRFYASGPDLSALLSLRDYGLDVRGVGAAIGQASALKMSYAALTKGLQALGAQLLIAGALAGVSEALAAELRDSQPALQQWIAQQLPRGAPKAHRWVAEMEEIAKTFADCGLPDGMMMGAAAFFAFVASSPLGREASERRERGRTAEEFVEILSAACATGL